jgi:integrase
MSKRANGEGTVYQRKDGRWVAVIPLEDGKHKFIYRQTQREAIKELQRANQTRMQGTFITTGEQTLETFLTSWLQDTAQPNLRPRTYYQRQDKKKEPRF